MKAAVVLVILVALVAGVGGAAWWVAGSQSPAVDDGLSNQLKNLAGFPLFEYVPPAAERGKLDDETRQAIELLEKLLPELQKRWPGRIVAAEDKMQPDGTRQLQLRV